MSGLQMVLPAARYQLPAVSSGRQTKGLPTTGSPLPTVSRRQTHKIPATSSQLSIFESGGKKHIKSEQRVAGNRQRTTFESRKKKHIEGGQTAAGISQRATLPSPNRHQPKPTHSLTSNCAVCLWIPNFPLRAEERRKPELSEKPTALLSPTDTRKVWQLSTIARRQGVQTGMTVSQAIGLCPQLTILEPDPVYYDEQFAGILAALTKVSPVVEPVELGRAYIGVDGLDRLVGDPAKQIRTIEHALGSDRGIRRWVNRDDRRKRLSHNRHSVAVVNIGEKRTADRKQAARGDWGEDNVLKTSMERGGRAWSGLRLGWARGKFASWVAACRAKPGQPVILSDPERNSFLSQQSIVVLPVESDTHRRLWQLGIKTLKNLAALPREAVISQFGREGQIAWQLATGMVVEPVNGQSPPENIVTSIEFPLPVADRQILNYAIGKLIERSLRDPRRIGWRVQTFRVRGALEHGSSWLIEITLRDPSADCKSICAPIEAKLDQSPPTGALENISVEFTSLIRGTSELQLFARDASSAARAGRRRALRWASQEIQKRLKRSMLHHIIEVHPWSRLPERRYALIDYDP